MNCSNWGGTGGSVSSANINSGSIVAKSISTTAVFEVSTFCSSFTKGVASLGGLSIPFIAFSVAINNVRSSGMYTLSPPCCVVL